VTTSLLGVLVGALAGGVAGFVAAIALQLVKGVRNAIMARRGAGQLRDMILAPLHIPGALLGALLGGVVVHGYGLEGAAVAACVPPLALLVLAVPTAIWVAFTVAPLPDVPDLPPGDAPPADEEG
jgi:hypothetical protein